MGGGIRELLRAFRPTVKVTDPLEVELVASGLLGSWWKGLPPGEDPDRLFGEGAIGYGARQGGREAMALLDFNHPGGWVKDVFLTDEPARVLRELRRDVARNPITVLDQVGPAEVRRLLEAGFEMTWQPEASEEFRQYRALALARCRVLPQPPEAAAESMEVPEGLREALVAEFLASPQTGVLPDDEA